VEQQWSRPTGLRRLVQGSLILLGNFLPPLVFLGSAGYMLWHIFMDGVMPSLTHALVPLFLTLLAMVGLHVLIALVLPLRWGKIRNEFQGLLEERLRKSLTNAYANVPVDLAEELRSERRKVEDIVKEVREVAAWLERRQQSASIMGLYG